MTEFPIRISGEKFDDWVIGRNKRTGLSRSDIFGEVGVRAIRSVQPFAIAEEAEAITGRSGADAMGRSPEEEMANDVVHVLTTLWNIDKHRRLPPLTWVTSLLWWSGTDKEAPTITSSRPANRFCVSAALYGWLEGLIPVTVVHQARLDQRLANFRASSRSRAKPLISRSPSSIELCNVSALIMVSPLAWNMSVISLRMSRS